jgi:hypothetical protein
MLSRVTECPIIFFNASEHSRNVENILDFCNRTNCSRKFYGGLMQAKGFVLLLNSFTKLFAFLAKKGI